MSNTVRIALLVVLSICLHATQEVLACSCVGPSGRGILTSHASVFAGRVENIQYLEPDTPALEPPIRVTFDVSEVWKGPVRGSLVVSTVYNKASCFGYFFKQGRSYLVAVETVTRDDPATDIAELEGVYLCGGTKLLADADSDLAALGEGTRIDGNPRAN